MPRRSPRGRPPAQHDAGLPRAVELRPARARSPRCRIWKSSRRAWPPGSTPPRSSGASTPPTPSPMRPPGGAAFAKVPTRAWIGVLEDETAASCTWSCPSTTGWRPGATTRTGALLTLQQPAVGALYDTRQGEDILLSLLKALGGNSAAGLPRLPAGPLGPGGPARREPVPFERFWQAALHDGLRQGRGPPPPRRPSRGRGHGGGPQGRRARGRGFELLLRPGTQVYDGRYANNGWLQELPDPITKITWGNPLSLSVADAKTLGVKDGDLVELGIGDRKRRAARPAPAGPGRGRARPGPRLRPHHGQRGQGRRHQRLPAPGPGSRPVRRSAQRRSSPRPAAARSSPSPRATTAWTAATSCTAFTLAEFAKAKKQARSAELADPLPRPGVPRAQVGHGHRPLGLRRLRGLRAWPASPRTTSPWSAPSRCAKGREMHWIRIDRYYEGERGEPRRWCTSPCSASTATTRPARTSAR